MIRAELERLLDGVPFEPFRIKLANGDYHDIFAPETVAPQHGTLMIAAKDGNWAIIPYGAISALESLFPDFHGELAKHEQA